MVFNRTRQVISLALTLAAVALAPACSKKAEPPADSGMAAMMAMAVPVALGKVVQKTVPVELGTIGNVEAYSAVSVKSQVEGQLDRVHFTEGQDVHKGDLLFTINSRPYEAALRQSEANLARDTAQAAHAKSDEERYLKLSTDGIVSKEKYDEARTNREALDAAVRADRAAVENVQIQLGYCVILAPIEGRTGSLIVHAGNIVKANDLTLVVINQVRPIYVNFSVPEQYLSEIRRRMASGELHVQASIPGEEKHAEEGLLSFVDNAVDSATGTIHLKGTFANSERRLWPGQFVNVVLTLSSHPNAIVAPSQAVQTGQAGRYVFVVKPDLTVDSRPVVVGETYEGVTVIEKGLQAGDRVVTDGQMMLYPGAKIMERTGPESASRSPEPEQNHP